MRRKDGETGGAGVTRPQGDMHTVAAVAVCRNALVCTWWLLWLSVEMPWLALGGSILALFAQINRLRKHCSHLVGSSFLAVKAVLPLNGC